MRKEHKRYGDTFQRAFQHYIDSHYRVRPISFGYITDLKNLYFMFNYLQTLFAGDEKMKWLQTCTTRLLDKIPEIYHPDNYSNDDKQVIAHLLISIEDSLRNSRHEHFISTFYGEEIRRGVDFCKSMLGLNSRPVTQTILENSPLHLRETVYFYVTNSLCLKTHGITVPVDFPDAWNKDYFTKEGAICVTCHTFYEDGSGQLDGLPAIYVVKQIAESLNLVEKFQLSFAGNEELIPLNCEFAIGELPSLTPRNVLERMFDSIPESLQIKVNGNLWKLDEVLENGLQTMTIMNHTDIFKTQLITREKVNEQRLMEGPD